jgi:hypothetical protein
MIIVIRKTLPEKQMKKLTTSEERINITEIKLHFYIPACHPFGTSYFCSVKLIKLMNTDI